MDRVPTVGRPRDTALDARILAAVLAVLKARGPDGVTVEAVAQHANCGKTSIYRRYHNSEEILAAALSTVAQTIPPPEGGTSPSQQLITALEQFRSGIEGQIGLRGIAALLYDPQSPFARLMRRHLLAPRLQIVLELVGRAVEAGEVPPTLDPQQTVHALAGSYFAELALTGQVGRNWAQHTVDNWQGLSRGAGTGS